jgi:hypothetical protein
MFILSLGIASLGVLRLLPAIATLTFSFTISIFLHHFLLTYSLVELRSAAFTSHHSKGTQHTSACNVVALVSAGTEVSYDR